MAFTQAQLEALEQSIARGVRRVQYADEAVEYRSLDEMIRLRNTMRRQLGGSLASGRTYAQFSKGL